MNTSARRLKRTIDLMVALVSLMLAAPIILVCWAIATIETRQNGLFFQTRVGLGGCAFRLVKIRTIKNDPLLTTTVTTAHDPRITRSGRWLRRLKLDELPQLWNVVAGDMSFVGPRPDVPGFADELDGEAALILTVRPGITGPATLKYRNEEQILSRQQNPEAFNREVIFPDKVRINLDYVQRYSLRKDIKYVLRTIFGRRDE